MDDTALMDAKEKEVKDMAVLKKDVSMGYVRVKLWPLEEFPGNWATVNDRDITKQRSVAMFKSFNDAGQVQVKKRHSHRMYVSTGMGGHGAFAMR